MYLVDAFNTEEHLQCFQVSAVTNKNGIHLCAGFYVGIRFQLIWVNIKLLGHVIRRCCQIVFQSSLLFLFPLAMNRNADSPHPHQHLVLSEFQILAILISMQQYRMVVLICTSLMTYDAMLSIFLYTYFPPVYRLLFHFPLSYIGEGNGNPLQCSCLENPRDGGAWWAAVYGVTQSRT